MTEINAAIKRQYATVRILDVPFHADRQYEYYIPAELCEKVGVGTVVSVPFGKGNRRVAAVVTKISDTTEFEKVKPIEAASMEKELLDTDAMDMCRFLCDYTLCTFGEAVKNVVPASAMSHLDEYYSVGEKIPPQMKLSEKSQIFYNYIAARGSVSSQKLVSQFGEEAATLASSLLKKEYLKKDVRVKEATNNRYITYVSVNRDGDYFGKKQAIRSELQREILSLLEIVGRITTDELYVRLERGAGAQVSALEKKGLVTVEKVESYRNPYLLPDAKADNSPLSPGQKEAYNKLDSLYSMGGARAALLHGVTGSGKTRVIKAMIDRVIEDGRGVIMLIPEISLTPQTVSYFCACYKERVAVIHSSLSQGERYDAWKRIRRGKADIVIGTRSAIFAPVKNLGMIVIDEEQEHTYKSDTDPKYLAHDVARFRCGKCGAFMLLSSATPSLSSYYKAESGNYTLVELTERYGNAKLPQVVISDMRQEPGGGYGLPIGATLAKALTDTYNEGHQSIVFLNRRGYNSTVACRVCGEALVCPQCSVSLTYHTKLPLGESSSQEEYLSKRRSRGALRCHYCGYKTEVPKVCPNCQSEHFKFVGCGTQQAQEALEKLLPGAKVLRMDMDTTQTKNSHEKILKEFKDRKGDVLLGTQMVTKGHDFPAVTLVGVLNADQSLLLDDFKAEEKTFSMLTQVIGRAGRGDAEGKAIIQTLNPDSEVIRLAANQDYVTFYKKAIRLRKAMVFPPFCDLAVLTLSSTDESLLTQSASRLSEYTKQLLDTDFKGVEAIMYGPFEAPVYKVQNTCRMRLVIKCRLTKETRRFLATVLWEFSRAGKNLNITVDINPSSL